MADLVEELIKEIAAKHGVAVGRGDPIMILHTMNARLAEENAAAQQAVLDRFKQEFEALATRWNGDATEKAERVLNATLGASKNLMREAANAVAASIRGEIDRALSEYAASLWTARQVSILNIVASLITLLAVALTVWAVMYANRKIQLCFLVLTSLEFENPKAISPQQTCGGQAVGKQATLVLVRGSGTIPTSNS